jgi:hypothetical protein
MRSTWLLLTLLLTASLPAIAQTTSSLQPEGTISGTVLNEHEQPFKGVRVCTYMPYAPSGSVESRGGCPATTDEAGQFRIEHVVMGSFGVEAIKPEDGYTAFAGTSAKEMVTLTPNKPSATVVLKLGPKPGLVLPEVTDKLTGKPVLAFRIGWAIYDPERLHGSLSGGQEMGHGDKHALVPPEKLLVLTVVAPGYKEWTYRDASDASRPALVRLHPSEVKELFVELEPEETAIH